MKTVIITVACTVLATTLLLAAVTFYYVSQKPKTYTCQKLEGV